MIQRLSLRVRAGAAAGITLGLLAGSAAVATAASADPVTTVKDLGGGALYNAGRAVFIVKDLGGGGYYNVTTGAQYVLATGTSAAAGTVVTAGATGGTLLATAAADGSGALLLANGTVIVPVQRTLPGGG